MIVFSVVLFVLLVVLIFGLWAVIARRSQRRTSQLSDAFPEAVVLQASAGSALRRALDDWADGPILPLTFSIMADGSGVGFWRDINQRIDFIQWADIVSANFVEVPERGRSTRGIELVVEDHGSDRSLPIMVLGAGPFGSLPLARVRLTEICAQLETWRSDFAGGRAR